MHMMYIHTDIHIYTYIHTRILYIYPGTNLHIQAPTQETFNFYYSQIGIQIECTFLTFGMYKKYTRYVIGFEYNKS
jgi:hypothetical protein